MCEFTSEVNRARCNGRFVAEVYPRQNQVLPYNRIKPGQ